MRTASHRAIVPEELEQCTVKFVRSRLGRDIDLRRSAPELGRKNPGLNLELLQRVDRGKHDICIEVDIGILDAVERKVVELAPLARNRNVLLRARSSLAVISLACSIESIADVGAERDKLKEVAPVKRHLDDTPVLDDSSDRSVFRRNQ